MNKRLSSRLPLVHALGLCKVCIFALLVLCFPALVKGQPAPVVIDFEGLPPQPVLSQYADKGVTFNGPLATDFSIWPGFAHSGTKGVQLCFAQEFCSAPLRVDFTTGQAHAKLWIGYIQRLETAQTVVLQAFDGNNALLEDASVILNPSTEQIPIKTPLEINTPIANIRYLILKFDAGPGTTSFNNGLLIDDVEFSTAGPAPPCLTSVRPSVALVQPRSSLLVGQPTKVQINEFMLQGVVQTDVLLDEATMTITGAGGTKTIDLLSSGTISRQGGTFGATRMNGALSPGDNSVSIQVRNCAGQGADDGIVNFTPIAAGTGFKVLRVEVNQVTQDFTNSVPLVADKPTMVRVYLSMTGPTTSLTGITGAITATRPGGVTLSPLLTSTNKITVDSSTDLITKRRSLNATLNFVLPAEWIAPSTLHFQLSKLYLEGHETNLPCDGCRNLDEIGAPRYVQFRTTKPLNLVLAPYVYERSKTNTPTPDLIFTPMIALQWVNNVYPLPGNFPGWSGIRLLRYLPMRSTNRDLKTDDGGADFLDDLQDVLDNLHDQNDWPSDTRLLAMTPFGGGGREGWGTKVAYADTWAEENGLIPEAQYEYYGLVWSHELGHSFGRKHLGNSHSELPSTDLNSPFPHGGIGPPGLATGTNWWRMYPPSIIDPGTAASGSQHAHDFMSYGSNSGDHTRSWISPYTYNALFKSFEDLTQTSLAAAAPAPHTEKLVVTGRTNAYGEVTLRPFRRVTTGYTSGSGSEGEFSVELVNDKGKTLLSHRFDPEQLENSKLLRFTEYVPWKKGAQLILIKRGKKVVARRSVSQHQPWVRVISPKKGEAWGQKATIKWEAGDQDKDLLTYTVLYNSGLDSIWVPVANGLKENSVTVDTTLLAGSARARIRVRVTDGVNSTEAESEIFTVSEKSPRVAILSPTAHQALPSEARPQLIAAAYDPEDGMLPSTSLTWTSDRDGVLAQDKCQLMRPLSPGDHVITVTATDSQGHSATASVRVVVSRGRIIAR